MAFLTITSHLLFLAPLIPGRAFASKPALPSLAITPPQWFATYAPALCIATKDTNHTLSLRISKTNHSLIADVWENGCNEDFSDSITFNASTTNTTVPTLKLPLFITSVKFPPTDVSSKILQAIEEDVEEKRDAQERRAVPCGSVKGSDACTGEATNPNDIEHMDGPSTLNAANPNYGRDVAGDDILGTTVEFSFNGTSFERVLGTPKVADCSDGNDSKGQDGCDAGETCCRCIF